MQNARFFVRIARLSEAERILRFYSSHPDRFLLPRPENEFVRAIERGRYFLIEEENRIVAAAGIFDYVDGGLPVELAETRVVTSVQGFGLQKFLFRLRIASVTLAHSGTAPITTAIDAGNEASLRNARSLGFVPWEPSEEAYASCGACPARSEARRCCCDFYVLPMEALKRSIRDLLKETENKLVILRRSDGTEMRVRCEPRFLVEDELRADLAEFADEEDASE